MDVKMVAAKDYYLSKRLEDLTADRDSALQNSQDLLHGMQVAEVVYHWSSRSYLTLVYQVNCVSFVIVNHPRLFHL